MKAKFRNGELVRLRSGGPTMTVQEEFFSPFKGREYRCKWFVGDKCESNIFHGDSLEKVREDEKK